MDTQPMKASELGRFVCVAHGGCLHSPHRMITSDGVWVKQGYGGPVSSAHRDCYERWAAAEQTRERLEALRAALRTEDISYGELAELQALAPYIEPGDTELLEAAGVPEFPDA